MVGLVIQIINKGIYQEAIKDNIIIIQSHSLTFNMYNQCDKDPEFFFLQIPLVPLTSPRPDYQ